MTTNTPNIWEYHPDWDTPTSYQRFIEFYLSQHPPRSYLKAYRQFSYPKLEESQQRARIKETNGKWNQWTQGRNSKGEKIEGCPTWKERAIAYDVHLLSAFDEAKSTRRVKYLERTLDRTGQIEDKWDEMFAIAKILRQTGIKRIPIINVDEDGKETTEWVEVEIRKLNVSEFRNLIGALNDSDKLVRRSLGMAEEIKQTQLGDGDGNVQDIGSGLVDILASAFQSFQTEKFDDEDNKNE